MYALRILGGRTPRTPPLNPPLSNITINFIQSRFYCMTEYIMYKCGNLSYLITKEIQSLK